MSEEREDAPSGKGTGRAGAWKGSFSSALLVAAVGGILVTGFVLKAERPGTSVPEATTEAPPPSAILLGSTITPEPATTPLDAPATAPAVGESPPDDPSFERLAARAAADMGRLETVHGPWTAQLLVACRLDTVDRVLAASRGAAKLYVLPAEVHGDACFRICWGAYRSAKEASAAADLPKALRGKDRIAAVEIGKVLR